MMKIISFKLAIITAGTAIVATLGSISNATAASLSFTPTGTELNDGDPIKDIVQSGGRITFEVFVNLARNEFNDNLNRVDYSVEWDITELSGATYLRPPNIGAIAVIQQNQGRASVVTSGLNLGDPDSDVSISLGEFEFDVSDPTVNNGFFDFKLNGVTSAILNNGVFVTNRFVSNQEVEVQPVPEPSGFYGPTIFSLFMGGDYLLKRKRKLKQKEISKLQ